MSEQRELTAMQELIEWCELHYGRSIGMTASLYRVVSMKAIELLPKEKSQIVDAIVDCVRVGTERESELTFSADDETIVRKDAEDYYSLTYKSMGEL